MGFFVIYVSELNSSAFCEAADDEAFLAADISFRVPTSVASRATGHSQLK